MPKIARFGVSLEGALLARLDAIAKERGYASRSQAIADFVRRALVKKEWKAGADCAATLTLAFPPEEKGALKHISAKLKAQAGCVMGWQLFGLSGGRLLAVIALKGKPARLQKLADELRGHKAVRHGSFSITAPC